MWSMAGTRFNEAVATMPVVSLFAFCGLKDHATNFKAHAECSANEYFKWNLP